MSYEYRLQKVSSMPLESDDSDELLDMQLESQTNAGASYGDDTADNKDMGKSKDNQGSNQNQEFSGADFKQEFSPVIQGKNNRLNDAQLFSHLIDSNNLHQQTIRLNEFSKVPMANDTGHTLGEKRLGDQLNNTIGSPTAFIDRSSQANNELSAPDSKALKEGLFEKLSTARAAENVAFSIEFGSGRTVDVKANNLPNRWTIALMVRDPEFKKKLQESQAELTKSIQGDIGKQVDIQVK